MAVVGGSSLFGHEPARATSGPPAALASASGVFNTLRDDSEFPLGAVVEADGPIAQAQLDQTGESVGFAADPYPGAFALAIPGTVSAETGGRTPAPPYPLYVSSRNQGPTSASVTQPALTLEAQSTNSSSKASATSGVASPASIGYTSTSASVAADQITGRVTSVATGETDALVAGPLRIARVYSQGQAVNDPASGLKTASNLEVDGITVAGVSVGVTPQGLVIGGTSTPLPADPLGNELTQAGISVTYVSAEPARNPRGVIDGIVSPGLKITYTQPGKANGLQTVSVLGRSVASASGDGRELVSALPAPRQKEGILNVGAFPLPSTPVTGSASNGQVSASVSSGPSGPVQPSSGPAPPPSSRSGSPSGGGPSTITRSPLLVVASPGAGFYLVLVVAAVLALAFGQLIRWVGVRWARSS